MSEKKSLIKKLTDIMSEVDRVPKNGKNTFHNYEYVTESDLLDALRNKLASKGVMIIPSVEKTTVHTGAIQTKSGSQSLTDIEMSFTIYDAESEESITAKWAAQGADGGDKGIYKAMTGGLKYFLMKTFLVSTGDDPEGEKEAHTPSPKQPLATKHQQESIVSLLEAIGKPRPTAEWLSTLTVINADHLANKLQAEIDAQDTPPVFVDGKLVKGGHDVE